MADNLSYNYFKADYPFCNYFMDDDLSYNCFMADDQFYNYFEADYPFCNCFMDDNHLKTIS